MQEDTISIQSASDLDQAIQSAQEKLTLMGDQLKIESRQLPLTVGKAALRKSVPFLLGAGTMVLGALLIRKWMRRSQRVPVKAARVIDPPPPSPTVSKAVALQLLPVVFQLVKILVNKKKSASHPAKSYNSVTPT